MFNYHLMDDVYSIEGRTVFLYQYLSFAVPVRCRGSFVRCFLILSVREQIIIVLIAWLDGCILRLTYERTYRMDVHTKIDKREIAQHKPEELALVKDALLAWADRERKWWRPHLAAVAIQRHIR